MGEREEPCVPGTEDHQRDAERRFAALYQAYYRPILAYRRPPGRTGRGRRRRRRRRVHHRLAADRRAARGPGGTFVAVWGGPAGDRRRRSARRLFHLTARLRADHGLPASDLPGARDTTRDLVLDALDRLPPAEREALQLVLWEELSHAEAAQVIGCSANAVAIRVHRAKTRPRRELSATELPATKRPGTEGPGTGMSGPRSAPETTPTHAWMNRS